MKRTRKVILDQIITRRTPGLGCSELEGEPMMPWSKETKLFRSE